MRPIDVSASVMEQRVDPWWTYCPNCGNATTQPRATGPQRLVLAIFRWIIPDLETGMAHVRHCQHCGGFEVVPPQYPGLRCQQCGYDLTGSESDHCPECGWLLPVNLKACRDRDSNPRDPSDQAH